MIAKYNKLNVNQNYKFNSELLCIHNLFYSKKEFKFR